MTKLKTAGLIGVAFGLGIHVGSWIKRKQMLNWIDDACKGKNEKLNAIISEGVDQMWSELEPILSRAIDEEVNRRIEEA